MMRRVREGTALALAMLLAACAGEDGDGASGRADGGAAEAFCQEVEPRVEAWLAAAREEAGPPEGERYGGTAVVGAPAELPAGLNAFAVGDYASRQHQQFVGLMPLLRYDPDLQLQPWLAESWELSEDGSQVTFRLRDDVTWHDGEPTDAEDVAFTYARITNPETGFPNAGYWRHWVPGAEGVEVVDAHTVRMRMEPHGDPLYPWTTVGIMPEHLLGDVPPAELGQHPYGTRCPVGNGPFVFREHRPGDRWRFDANPAFPEELGGRPYLDRYVVRVIPEQTTLLTELLTGGLDVYVAAAPDHADEILAEPDVELRTYPWPGYVFVGWNTRRPTLADARVRRALTMATDREEVVGAVLQGYGEVAYNGIPPFHWAHQDDPPGVLEHDPEAARALLDEAGWIDRDGDGIRENEAGEPLSFSIRSHHGNRQRQAIAEIMQSQLREVGVDARPELVEWSTLVSQIMSPERDFDGVVMAWTTDFRLAEGDLFRSDLADGGALAFPGVRSPAMDTLLVALDTVRSRERARSLWDDYLEVLSQEQPYTHFYHPDRLDGVSRRLRDVVMDPRGEWVNLKDWWIDPAER